MSQEHPKPLAYHLETEGPLVDKVSLRAGKHVSRFMSRPLRPVVDRLLGIYFKERANNEVWQAYRENWLNYAVRFINDPLDRPKQVHTIAAEDIGNVRKRELSSGVSKVTAKVAGKKVTSFIAPEGFVPFSMRTMDMLPDKHDSIPVSATLRHVSKKVKNDADFPAIQMTAAGWNFMMLFSDAVYVSSLDEQPASHHVRRHIRDTISSIDTRSDAEYFTLDNFYDIFYNPPRPYPVTTTSPHLPGREQHWLVTNRDGSLEVMSASQIRDADTDREGFKNKIASITSTLGYVNHEISQEPLGEGAVEQLVNAVVLFTVNGQQRVGSIHAQFDTNAIAMFNLANTMITNQFPDAENVGICIMDGGGSSGAIVQKKSNWQQGIKNKFDRSTLPPITVSHEVPIYTAMVPADYVRDRYK